MHHHKRGVAVIAYFAPKVIGTSRRRTLDLLRENILTEADVHGYCLVPASEEVIEDDSRITMSWQVAGRRFAP